MIAKTVGSEYTTQYDEQGAEAPCQLVMGDSGPDIFGDQVTITQIFKAAEAAELCGCEARNRYTVTGAPQPLYISEESDCFERICCGPGRSLTFNLHDGPTESAPIVYKFNKSFHIQICCCDSLRPKMDIIDAHRGVFLGRAFDPCKWCTIDNRLYDANNKHIYTTTGPLCQGGVICPCGDSLFRIVENTPGHISGQPTAASGVITKVFNGLSEICLQVNKFRIDFPKDASPGDKTLLVGSALLLDIQYFEKQK